MKNRPDKIINGRLHVWQGDQTGGYVDTGFKPRSMKMHPSFSKVLAAARSQLSITTDGKARMQLKQAIDNVVMFRNDNDEFILHYNADAGL